MKNKREILVNPLKNLISYATKTGFREEYVQAKLRTTSQQYLEKLILHAYNNVPYYHDIFKRNNIIINGKVDLSKFSKIPILTKDIITEQKEDLYSRDYKTRKWNFNSSGGSTGEPVRFIQDNIYRQWGNAANYYWYKDILGVDEPAAKKVILWGSERDIIQGGLGWRVNIFNWLNNIVFLNSFNMAENDIEQYIKFINLDKPDIIRGYAGSLYELCRFADNNKKEIYTPRIVVSSAEMLTNGMRKEIEKVFKTKVHNYYGSRETNNLAGECKEGLMHIFTFHNHIEILDKDNNPVKEGKEGKVIVTNLHNYSMPFIRYEIGDMAVLGTTKCKCGNMLPTLKNITGRITNYFIKEDGTIVYGEYFTHLFYLKDWVKAFRIIQEDYYKIKILLVLKSKINEFEKQKIESNIRLVMGEDCRIIWDFVEDIPKTSQGKYLYTKSNILK